MPTYQFLCDSDDGGCDHVMEIICLASDREELRPKSCPKCRKRKTIHQVFGDIKSHIPKTLGYHADKQASKLSEDERTHLNKKHNEYKQPSKDGPSFVEVDGRFVHRSQLE